jgi:hypothetical protein
LSVEPIVVNPRRVKISRQERSGIGVATDVIDSSQPVVRAIRTRINVFDLMQLESLLDRLIQHRDRRFDLLRQRK